MSEFLISDWGLKGSAIVLSLIFIGLIVAFLVIPYNAHLEKEMQDERDLVREYNCDDLKQFIVEDIEDKTAHWQRNVALAKEYFTWKCHN